MSATRTSPFARLFRRNPKTIRHAKPIHRAHLGLTALEARDVPAYVSGGILMIDGTNGADTVSVSQTIPANWYELAKVRVVQNGVTQDFSKSLIRSSEVQFRGNGGNDYFQNTAFLYVVADGGSGSDTLRGGPMDDQLRGGTNNDSLYGGDGNDDLYGEQGDDRLYGASGYDGFENGSCNDTLQGGDGSDSLYGGYGSDILIGGNDNDWIQGQWGDDLIVGANWDFGTSTPNSYEIPTVAVYTTNDTLFGENGNDTLYGGDGNDDMSGGFDNDVLYGEGGNDRMWGAFWDSTSERPNSTNNDTLFGGEGGDQLYGGDGSDWLWGEGGGDVLYGQNGSDALDGGTGNDQLYGDGGTVTDPGNDNLVGGEGQDWLYGGPGSDTLWGAGWQNNYDYQDSGNYLFGEGGNDNLYGADGYDWLDGGAGDDGLFGGLGYNVLNGGADDDRFLTWSAAVDNVQDADGRDAVIQFADSPALNDVDPPGGWPNAEPYNFDAGMWTAAEITSIAPAFDNLERVTGNTTLLALPDRTGYVFTRRGKQTSGDWDFGGQNLGDGNIIIGQLRNDTLDTTDVLKTIYHEVGHSWLWSDANLTHVQDFLNLSGWQRSHSSPGADFAASGAEGDDWWYRTSASFARQPDGTGNSYSQLSPDEDWATTWETYFMDKFHGTTVGNNIVQGKYDQIELLFADLWD